VFEEPEADQIEHGAGEQRAARPFLNLATQLAWYRMYSTIGATSVMKIGLVGWVAATAALLLSPGCGSGSGGGTAQGGSGGSAGLGGHAGGGGSRGGNAGFGGAGGAGGAAAGIGGGAGLGGVGGAGGAVAVNCDVGGFIGSSGSLLSDGGFECPIVSQGSFTSYATGQQFFGWSVVGAAGSVSALSGAYTNGGYSWPAHGGSQTLDLTGNASNSAVGVAQTVATTPQVTYHLSFWIGNLVAPGTEWGTSSTVNVTVDGTQLLTATNSDGAGSTAITWKQFTLDFTATMSATTIAFINGDPSTDNSNLLDDVALN
jgi:Protein of unknown function (DUF642)